MSEKQYCDGAGYCIKSMVAPPPPSQHRELNGSSLIALRKAAGLKAKDLADLLDISPEHLCRMESGERPISRVMSIAIRAVLSSGQVELAQHREPIEADREALLRKFRDELTRPIVGIENRTAQQVFDIMADRVRYKFNMLSSRVPIGEALHSEVDHWPICEGCAKPVLPGQFVHLYDEVGEVHVDCDAPFKVPNDPKAVLMLGDPMRHRLAFSTPAASDAIMREALEKIAKGQFTGTSRHAQSIAQDALSRALPLPKAGEATDGE